jgi:tetratricopeptide (TPR) repeat protein
MSVIIGFIILQTQLLDPHSILKFADYLYMQEDYAAAISEYRRYLFLNDSTENAITEKIIDCFIKIEKFEEAIKESANLKDDTKTDYLKGWIYFLSGDYDSSRIYLGRVGIPYQADAKKIIGLGYACQFRFQEAGKYIKLPEKTPRYKKPFIGAMCALFPGGGHFYCGRFGDGAFSLLVIGTGALLSYYYYHRAEDLKFGISLGLTVLFYAGNIYGGINTVRNYNYYQNEKYLRKILEGSK